MPSSQRVYIGNLSDDARERDVERFFKGYGKLREIALKMDMVSLSLKTIGVF